MASMPPSAIRSSPFWPVWRRERSWMASWSYCGASGPDFALIQSRDKTRSPLKIRTLSRTQPATYIAFDLLYEHYVPLLGTPLLQRRQCLERFSPAPKSSSARSVSGNIGQGPSAFRGGLPARTRRDHGQARPRVITNPDDAAATGSRSSLVPGRQGITCLVDGLICSPAKCTRPSADERKGTRVVVWPGMKSTAATWAHSSWSQHLPRQRRAQNLARRAIMCVR